MKTNEAPEKIYVHIRYKPCEITFSEVKEEGVSNVEYTRTDVFVEKVKEFLWSHIEGSDYHVNYILNEFEKYMKEE